MHSNVGIAVRCLYQLISNAIKVKWSKVEYFTAGMRRDRI